MQTWAKIIINGKVQMVGFITFIKNSADSFDIKGFAENLPDGTVKIVCEGEKDKITEYISYIKQESPSFAVIDDIKRWSMDRIKASLVPSKGEERTFQATMWLS